MHITKQMLEPSREDAVRLTRNERIAMLWFANADTTMEELQTSLAKRLSMVEAGPERLKVLAEDTDKLLNDVRLTIPIEQRLSLQNTGSDYEVRLTPKATPQVTSVVMMKEEFLSSSWTSQERSATTASRMTRAAQSVSCISFSLRSFPSMTITTVSCARTTSGSGAIKQMRFRCTCDKLYGRWL